MFWCLCWLLAVALLTVFLLARRITRMKADHDQERDFWLEEIEGARKDGAKRSRSVSLGRAVEHLVPFMPDFPFDPGDSRFLGSPVDFVVFAGLREADEVEEIVFVEVKTGKSRLSRREQSVRRAVEEGRVAWREERVGGLPSLDTAS